jgi:hypothetical protein
MRGLLMETDHWSALATANHQLEALKRHLLIAGGYGDDAEVSRIRADIASVYALRRHLLRHLGVDFSDD